MYSSILNTENILLAAKISSPIIAILAIYIAHLKYTHKSRIEALTDRYETKIDNINTVHKTQKEALDKADYKLIQKTKTGYVKYLHIKKPSTPYAYTKTIDRTGDTIEVQSECIYYRLNKFNKPTSITIKDTSVGAVDLNIIYPWKDVIVTDKPSQSKIGEITQDLSGSDTYFTATTYYNGFINNNEDIETKMEVDTECARLIADFSSIIGHDILFTEHPETYIISGETGQRHSKSKAIEISSGIYMLESYNLKKGDVMHIQFYVNWDALDN